MSHPVLCSTLIVCILREVLRRLVEVRQGTGIQPLDSEAVTAGGAINRKTHVPTALLSPLKPEAGAEVYVFKKKGKCYNFDNFLRWAVAYDPQPHLEDQLVCPSWFHFACHHPPHPSCRLSLSANHGNSHSHPLMTSMVIGGCFKTASTKIEDGTLLQGQRRQGH